jgi:hypothetical protein
VSAQKRPGLYQSRAVISEQSANSAAPAVRPVVADLGHVSVQRRLDVGPVEVGFRVLPRAGVVPRRPHDPPSLQQNSIHHARDLIEMYSPP